MPLKDLSNHIFSSLVCYTEYGNCIQQSIDNIHISILLLKSVSLIKKYKINVLCVPGELSVDILLEWNMHAIPAVCLVNIRLMEYKSSKGWSFYPLWQSILSYYQFMSNHTTMNMWCHFCLIWRIGIAYCIYVKTKWFLIQVSVCSMLTVIQIYSLDYKNFL